MFTKLVCFDFDGTLFYTPEPDNGRDIWEKETGTIFPGSGWWANPESLNTNIFYIPINEWVYSYYKKYIEDNSCYVFLASGRLKKLENKVLEILELNNIKFKPSWDSKTGVYCNTGGKTLKFKLDLFSKKISENPEVSEFIIFEDRSEHILNFIEWAKEQKIKVTIIDVINKKKFQNVTSK